MRILVAALALLLAAPSIAHAGPVGAAIAGIASWVGSTLAAGGVGAALLRIGAGFALSALSRALAPKPVKPKFPGLVAEFTAGEAGPLTIILGRAAVRGHAISPPYSDQLGEGALPNRYLVRPTILSDLPVTEIEGCYLNGTWIEFGSTPEARKGRPATTSPYAGYLWLNADLGAQTVANPIMRQNFGNEAERPWTADMIGRGKAVVYPTYKMTKEDNPYQGGGDPVPLWVVKGAALLDPRTGATTFTENPVVMIWNILRGIEIPGVGMWGLGVDEADLPAAIWHAEMDVCDEVPPGGGRRYRAGVEFGLNQEPLDIIGELLKACGGDIADCGGTWRIRAGPPPASVYSFTDDDVIITDGREFRMFPGLAETYNAVAATYADPRNGWESTAANPITNAAWEAEDGGRRLTAELTYPTVTYPEQVRRLMRETANDNRRFRAHILTLPPAALHIMPLDTDDWTSVKNGYDAKLFDLVEKAFDPIMLISRTFSRERNPSDYDWDAVSDSDLPSPPSRIGQDRTIYGVEGFNAVGTSVKDPEGADRRPAVSAVWTLRDVDGIEIEVVSAVTGLRAATKYCGQAEVNEGGTLIEAATILPAQSYKARARAVAADRPSTWSAFTAPFSTPGVFIGESDLGAEIRDKLDDAQDTAHQAAEEVIEAKEAADQVASDLTDAVETLRSEYQSGDESVIGRVIVLSSSPNIIVTSDGADGVGDWIGATTGTDVPSVAPSGARSLYLADGAREMPARLGNVNGRTFRVSGWGRLATSGGYSWMPGLRHSGSNAFVARGAASPPLTSMAWQHFSHQFTVSEDTPGGWMPAIDIAGGPQGGGQGGEVRVLWIVLEDITAAAEVREETYTKEDTDSAIAASVGTVQASVNGLSATVGSISAVQADHEGFLQAYSGLTVETSGGFVSGFKATSFANPDGSGGAALQLLGTVFAPETVVASRVLVSAVPGNVVPDAQFRDPDAWTHTGNNWRIIATTSNFYKSPNVFQYIGPLGVGQQWVRSMPFPVQDWQDFRYSAIIVRQAAGTARVLLQVLYLDGAMVQLASGHHSSGWLNLTTNGEVSFVARPPTEARYARLRVVLDTGSPTTIGINFGSMAASQVYSNAATLLLPDSITTPNLFVDDLLTANKMAVNFLQGIFARFQTAEIDTLHLKNLIVSEQKVAFGAISSGGVWGPFLSDNDLDQTFSFTAPAGLPCIVGVSAGVINNDSNQLEGRVEIWFNGVKLYDQDQTFETDNFIFFLSGTADWMVNYFEIAGKTNISNTIRVRVSESSSQEAYIEYVAAQVIKK